jgi:hypothetical protein
MGRCGGDELRPIAPDLQMIDQNRFIKEFGPRFAHVHAKDVMIDRDGLYENGGILSPAWAGKCRGSAGWAMWTGPISSPAFTGSAMMAR